MGVISRVPYAVLTSRSVAAQCWRRCTILPGSRIDVPSLGGVSQLVHLAPDCEIAPPTRVPASQVRRRLGRSCVCFPLRPARRLSVEQKRRNKHGGYAICGALGSREVLLLL